MDILFLFRNKNTCTIDQIIINPHQCLSSIGISIHSSVSTGEQSLDIERTFVIIRINITSLMHCQTN